MIIANPIYDVTFKRLLENDRTAKFFIGTILNCKVLSLEPTVREHTKFDKDTGKLTLFRMDFAATIKTKEEGEKRVIIEMQKAMHLADVTRFREYLGTEYIKSELPIISIYILGFNLSVDSPAFGNVPVYRDLRTNEQLHPHDDFVEQLTHSAYFVQTQRIKPSLSTKLDRLLSVFEQANFIGGSETTKSYPLEVDDPEIKAVLEILHYAAADAQAREELDKEEYYRKAMEGMFGKQNRKLEQQAIEIAEQAFVINKSKQEAEESKQEAEEAKRETEEARQEAKEAKRKIDEAKQREKETVKNLRNKGFSSKEIAAILNITIEQVEES
ncbi:MAG: hypothetical protein LBI42_01300 [Chitinispirillales bacterium]|jgi:hypothetical protein|nr:hypothetical protein [Chitinispirillales bacterium]